MRIDQDFFHVGLVVPEVESAIKDLTALLGCEWQPIFEGGLAVHEPGVGEREVPMRIAMSTTAPLIEVIEARPGTPWELSAGGSNLHHLAFHTDDLDGESRSVAESFCPIEICGVAGDGAKPTTFTYHSRGGLRIELVDRNRIAGALRP